MRIAQITPYYYPSIGGVEKVVQYTSEELVRRGHEVTVLTAYRDHKERPPINAPKQEIMEGVNIKRYTSLWQLGHMSFCPGYYSELYKGNYDVIHYHNYRHPHCEMGAFMGKIKSAKTILHGHGPFFNQKSTGKLKSYIYNIYDQYAKFSLFLNTDHIIALNEFEKSQYQKLGIRENRITIVPNAAEKACFETYDTNDFKDKYNLQNKSIMMFLGILNAYKRPDLMIDALPQIVKKDPAVVLLLVGPDGGMWKVMESKIKKLNMENHVKWIGPLQGIEKHQAIASSKFMLLPSDEDPLPVVVLESLAHGKPLIGTRETGIANMIRHNETGFLIQKGDFNYLAQHAISLLTDNQLLRNLSNNAKKEAFKKYKVESAVDLIEAIYHMP